jgi:hypothetical protein
MHASVLPGMFASPNLHPLISMLKSTHAGYSVKRITEI